MKIFLILAVLMSILSLAVTITTTDLLDKDLSTQRSSDASEDSTSRADEISSTFDLYQSSPSESLVQVSETTESPTSDPETTTDSDTSTVTETTTDSETSTVLAPTTESETTTEPQPICLVHMVNVVNIYAFNATVEFETNLVDPVFSCELTGDNELIIKLLSSETLGTRVENVSLTCDVLPAQQYLLKFDSICDEFNTTFQTKFEELSCDTVVDFLKFNSTCEPLNCTKCVINFELREYNSNSVIETYKGNEFWKEFEEGECNYYELRAYISKSGFGKAPGVYKFNFNITPELMDSQFTYNFDYTARLLNFKIDNVWKKCVNSKLSVSVLNWLICDRPALEVFNFTNLTIIPDIAFNTRGAFFNKIYTLGVQLEKMFGNQIIKLNQKVFEIESGAEAIAILNITTVTADLIEFQYSRPRDCVIKKEIVCFNNQTNKTTPAILEEPSRAYKVGKCNGLDSNSLYTIISFNRALDGSDLTDSKSIETGVYPAQLTPPVYKNMGDYIDFNLSVSFTGSYRKSYICLKVRSTKIEPELDHCREETIPNNMLFVFRLFNTDELLQFLYGENYDMYIITEGADSTKRQTSNRHPLTQGLDKFHIKDLAIARSSQNTIHVALNKKTQLPNLNYGLLKLRCSSQNNEYMCQYNTEVQSEFVNCSCATLKSGTEYELVLINQKDGFNNASTKLNPIYTKVMKADLRSVTFISDSLKVNMVFDQPDGYKELEFGFRLEGKEENFHFVTIKNDTVEQDLKETGFQIFHDEIYEFCIKTTGFDDSVDQSTFKSSKSGLDWVKITTDLVTYRSEADSITVEFENKYLPARNYLKIAIKCNGAQFDCSSNRELGGNTTCTCTKLIDWTEYNIEVLTIGKRNGDFKAVKISPKITLPAPYTCRIDSQAETNITVSCQNDGQKIPDAVVIERINKETTNDIRIFCLERIKNNLRWLSRCTSQLQSLELREFTHTFTDLAPGNKYDFRAYSVMRRGETIGYESRKKIIEANTEIDEPTFIEWTSSSNLLSFSFRNPKTLNCELKFFLDEKKDDTFEEFSSILIRKDDKKEIEMLTFPREISSTHLDEYKIRYLITKSGVKSKYGSFAQIYTVPFPVYAIVLISVGGFILIAGTVAIFLIRHKKYSERGNMDQDTYTVKVREKVVSKPVRPEKLKSIIADWDEHQNAGLEAEWRELEEISAKLEKELSPMKVGLEGKNREKNRYPDVLPYDKYRVKLLTGDNDSDSYEMSITDDYINASFIPGLNSQTKYIACQAPTVNTFGDFWRMVFERYTTVIVMLATIYEKNRSTQVIKKKCDVYWPEKVDSEIVYGEIKVKLIFQKDLDFFIYRKFQIEADNTKQLICHYQYLTWPDKASANVKQMYSFMQALKKNEKRMTGKKGPIVVHCSAGIGRTGTYLAVDPLMDLISNNEREKIDIFSRVLEMRHYRPRMVQNSVQYRFIYELLCYHYEQINASRSQVTIEQKRKNEKEDIEFTNIYSSIYQSPKN